MYFLYPQKATLCCTFIKNHKVINCRREKKRTLKANGEMRTEESAEEEEVNDLSAYQRGREKKTTSTRSGKKAWSAELKWNACRWLCSVIYADDKKNNWENNLPFRWGKQWTSEQGDCELRLDRERRSSRPKKEQTWATETDLIKQVIKVDAGYL